MRSAWVCGFGLFVTLLAGCDATDRPVPAGMPAPSKLAGAPVVLKAALVIRNQHHRVYSGLSISTRAGDCIQVQHSTDITIEGSQVGPVRRHGSYHRRRQQHRDPR